jgi:flavin reductase ActVB
MNDLVHGGDRMISARIAPDLFRQAVSRFATGVTILTTADDNGQWWGLTASAFSSLSLDPPLILVCLARTAQSYGVFTTSRGFLVNVLGTEHERLALRFATKGADKFAGGEFRPGQVDGLPVLDDALACLKCRTHDQFEGGDHTVLIGEVEYVRVREGGRPALHISSRFWDAIDRDHAQHAQRDRPQHPAT